MTNDKRVFIPHIFFLNNEEQQLQATIPVVCPGQFRLPAQQERRCGLVVITDHVVLFIYVFTIPLDIVS
jgi:hypothetical protein